MVTFGICIFITVFTLLLIFVSSKNKKTFSFNELFFLEFPRCVIMSSTNGHTVSKETWDSHNKMMLDPLSSSDLEVCVYWIFETKGLNITYFLENPAVLTTLKNALGAVFPPTFYF